MIGAVDKEGVVHSGGSVGSAEAVDREEAVVRRYLQKILMLSWRSITQRQCRSIDEVSAEDLDADNKPVQGRGGKKNRKKAFNPEN